MTRERLIVEAVLQALRDAAIAAIPAAPDATAVQAAANSLNRALH